MALLSESAECAIRRVGCFNEEISEENKPLIDPMEEIVSSQGNLPSLNDVSRVISEVKENNTIVNKLYPIFRRMGLYLNALNTTHRSLIISHVACQFSYSIKVFPKTILYS